MSTRNQERKKKGFCQPSTGSTSINGAKTRENAKSETNAHNGRSFPLTRFPGLSQGTVLTLLPHKAQKAKSRGGTLITRAYIKEVLTVKIIIQSVCQKKSRDGYDDVKTENPVGTA